MMDCSRGFTVRAASCLEAPHLKRRKEKLLLMLLLLFMHAQIQTWLDAGVIEPSHAEALIACVEHPEWFDSIVRLWVITNDCFQYLIKKKSKYKK